MKLRLSKDSGRYVKYVGGAEKWRYGAVIPQGIFEKKMHDLDEYDRIQALKAEASGRAKKVGKHIKVLQKSINDDGDHTRQQSQQQHEDAMEEIREVKQLVKEGNGAQMTAINALKPASPEALAKAKALAKAEVGALSDMHKKTMGDIKAAASCLKQERTALQKMTRQATLAALRERTAAAQKAAIESVQKFHERHPDCAKFTQIQVQSAAELAELVIPEVASGAASSCEGRRV